VAHVSRHAQEVARNGKGADDDEAQGVERGVALGEPVDLVGCLLDVGPLAELVGVDLEVYRGAAWVSGGTGRVGAAAG
jgi:hypothetical protein